MPYVYTRCKLLSNSIELALFVCSNNASLSKQNQRLPSIETWTQNNSRNFCSTSRIEEKQLKLPLSWKCRSPISATDLITMNIKWWILQSLTSVKPLIFPLSRNITGVFGPHGRINVRTLRRRKHMRAVDKPKSTRPPVSETRSVCSVKICVQGITVQLVSSLSGALTFTLCFSPSKCIMDTSVDNRIT